MTTPGPFQTPTAVGEVGPFNPLPANNPAFRTPSGPVPGGDPGYVDSPIGAWAPTLDVSANSVPDSRRIGHTPIREYRTLGVNSTGRDANVRHGSAENIDADGRAMDRGTDYGTAKRAAPDSRRTPAPETRWTQLLSPARYTFTRPFDQRFPHRLTGVRFSMADHRRRYDDLQGGLLPQTTRRNTYRQDPGPWDQDMTDYPVNTPEDWGGYRTAAIPATGSRANRLDAY